MKPFWIASTTSVVVNLLCMFAVRFGPAWLAALVVAATTGVNLYGVRMGLRHNEEIAGR